VSAATRTRTGPEPAEDNQTVLSAENENGRRHDPKSLYAVIRKDRVGCRGGSVCALVKRSNSVLPLTLHEKYSELEIVGFDFVGGRPALRIFIVYRPPHYDYIATSYAKLLTECFTEYSNNHKYMHLVVGNFNLPYINWDVPIGPDDDIYKIVLDFLFSNGYSQLVHFQTRGHNLLDLLLTDGDMLVASVASHPPVALSDHVTMLQSYSQ